MKNITLHKTIMALAAVIILTISGSTGNVRAEENEGVFALELINWIRLDPLGYAEGLGYHRQTLLADLPWLQGLLDQGLPMLSVTEFLTQSAAASNDISGATARPVSGLENDYARTGNVSGLVSFLNFMGSRDAVKIVIDNQFKKELNWYYTGQRCILSRELDRGGVSLKSGVDPSSRAHAYFLAVSLGSSVLKLHRQVLTQINQFRNNPSDGASYIDAGLAGYQGSYAPLFFHDILQPFTATDFVDTAEYGIHAVNYGYGGTWLRKSSSLEIFPKSSLDDVALRVFLSLVVTELKGNPEGPVILDPGFTDIGLDISYVQGDADAHAYADILGGLSAAPSQGRVRIYGQVYADTSGDSVYTPGEGRGGRVVKIYDRQTLAQSAIVVTDNAGHFSACLPGGSEYIIQTASGEAQFWGCAHFDGDRFFAIKVAY